MKERGGGCRAEFARESTHRKSFSLRAKQDRRAGGASPPDEVGTGTFTPSGDARRYSHFHRSDSVIITSENASHPAQGNPLGELIRSR